jgi:hypothetical protein
MFLVLFRVVDKRLSRTRPGPYRTIPYRTLDHRHDIRCGERALCVDCGGARSSRDPTSEPDGERHTTQAGRRAHLQVAQRGGPVQRCELRRRACVQVAAALEVLQRHLCRLPTVFRLQPYSRHHDTPAKPNPVVGACRNAGAIMWAIKARGGALGPWSRSAPDFVNPGRAFHVEIPCTRTGGRCEHTVRQTVARGVGTAHTWPRNAAHSSAVLARIPSTATFAPTVHR